MVIFRDWDKRAEHLATREIWLNYVSHSFPIDPIGKALYRRLSVGNVMDHLCPSIPIPAEAVCAGSSSSRRLASTGSSFGIEFITIF